MSRAGSGHGPADGGGARQCGRQAGGAAGRGGELREPCGDRGALQVGAAVHHLGQDGLRVDDDGLHWAGRRWADSVTTDFNIINNNNIIIICNNNIL